MDDSSSPSVEIKRALLGKRGQKTKSRHRPNPNPKTGYHPAYPFHGYGYVHIYIYRLAVRATSKIHSPQLSQELGY